MSDQTPETGGQAISAASEAKTIEAFGKIAEILSTYQRKEQIRIIRAVSALCGIDLEV